MKELRPSLKCMAWTRVAQKSKKGGDTVRTVVVRNGARIPLGKQGENNAVRVVWPGIAEKYAKLYGDGRFELVVVQNGKVYPAVVNVDGADLIWNVLAADVAIAEIGSLELIYYVGDTIAKSQTWETFVEVSKSAEGTTEPPEPAKNWVDVVINTASDAKQSATESAESARQSAESATNAAASATKAENAVGHSPIVGENGNWFVWDFEKSEYVDSGKPASIGGGSDLSLGITGAQVGQIAKITAVDTNGKPTAWEPVDMPSGGETWEKIAEIVIPEGADETTALTINKDSDGNPFSLVKARLCAKFPKYTGATTIPNFSFTMLNGKTAGKVTPLAYTSVWPKVSASAITGTVYEIDVSGAQQIEHVIRSGNGGWTDDSSRDYAVYGAQTDTDTTWFGDTLWAKPITSIGGINMLIYPGCRFILYGVRA